MYEPLLITTITKLNRFKQVQKKIPKRGNKMCYLLVSGCYSFQYSNSPSCLTICDVTDVVGVSVSSIFDEGFSCVVRARTVTKSEFLGVQPEVENTKSNKNVRRLSNITFKLKANVHLWAY